MVRTFQASETGMEMANQAFDRTGWTHDYLAGSVNCSRPTVSKFLAGKSIDKPFFKSLCCELGLKWQDVVDWELEELSNKVLVNSSGETCETMEMKITQAATTEEPKKSEERALCDADINLRNVDLEKLKKIQDLLREELVDFSLVIVDIKKGSVIIFLDGDPKSLHTIKRLFELGQLTELLEIRVLDAQFLTAKDSEPDKIRLALTINANISPEDLQTVKAALSNGDFRDAKQGYNNTSRNESTYQGSSINISSTRDVFGGAGGSFGSTEQMK